MGNRGEALSRINKGVHRGVAALRTRIPEEHIFRAKESATTATKTFIENPERFAPVIDRAGEIIADSSTWATRLILRSRESRLAAERLSGEKPGCLYYGVKTGIEIIPVLGDAVSIIEGVRGIEIGVGRNLDYLERGVSIVMGLIPGLPALPARSGIELLRRRLEDKVYQKHIAKL